MPHVKKNRTHLSGSSPRDRQRQTSMHPGSTDLVHSLMQKVDVLTSELNALKCNSSPVLQESSSSVADTLNSKIEMLEKLLQAKEDTIKALQGSNAFSNSAEGTNIKEVVEEPERPLILREVIDPTEDTSKLKSFIQTDSESPKSNETKSDIQDKISKLKSIMGGSI